MDLHVNGDNSSPISPFFSSESVHFFHVFFWVILHAIRSRSIYCYFAYLKVLFMTVHSILNTKHLMITNDTQFPCSSLAIKSFYIVCGFFFRKQHLKRPGFQTNGLDFSKKMWISKKAFFGFKTKFSRL